MFLLDLAELIARILLKFVDFICRQNSAVTTQCSLYLNLCRTYKPCFWF